MTQYRACKDFSFSSGDMTPSTAVRLNDVIRVEGAKIYRGSDEIITPAGSRAIDGLVRKGWLKMDDGVPVSRVSVPASRIAQDHQEVGSLRTAQRVDTPDGGRVVSTVRTPNNTRFTMGVDDHEVTKFANAVERAGVRSDDGPLVTNADPQPVSAEASIRQAEVAPVRRATPTPEAVPLTAAQRAAIAADVAMAAEEAENASKARAVLIDVAKSISEQLKVMSGQLSVAVSLLTAIRNSTAGAEFSADGLLADLASDSFSEEAAAPAEDSFAQTWAAKHWKTRISELASMTEEGLLWVLENDSSATVKKAASALLKA